MPKSQGLFNTLRSKKAPITILAVGAAIATAAVVTQSAEDGRCADPNVVVVMDGAEGDARRSVAEACAFGGLTMRAITNGDGGQIAEGNGWLVGPKGDERSACIENPFVSGGYFAHARPGNDGPLVTVYPHGGLDNASVHFASRITPSRSNEAYVAQVAGIIEPVGNLIVGAENCK